MSKRNVLLIYGEGGHRAEMSILYKNLSNRIKNNCNFIGLCENGDSIPSLTKNYNMPVIGVKYSTIRMYLRAIYLPPIILFRVWRIDSKYNISSVVSVGPGISIWPSIYFRLFKSKVLIIFIENSCKHKKSYTGRIMHQIANKFYVQNRSLLSVYKHAIYSGQLL